MLAGALPAGFRSHLLVERHHQPAVDFRRNHLRLESFVNLKSFLRGIHDYEAIRTLRHVPFQVFPEFLIDRLVQVSVQFVKELFTGKQTRRPLFA